MLSVSELKHLNAGECADIYAIDDHTVLKLSKPCWGRDLLYQEYLNGKMIGDSKIPAPKVYDFVEIEGRFGYTMDRLQDTTVYDLMWKHPGKIIAYAKDMAAIHAQIHSAEAPKELPLLVDKYRAFICTKNGIHDDIKEQIIRELERLNAENKCCICHGDFHPINVLVDGDRYFVIDWVLAVQGNPEADVAGTYLITKIYSSNIRGKSFFRSLAAALGGKLIAGVYLNEYIAITKTDRQKILRWIPIRAATYIDVGLPERMNRMFKRILAKHYKKRDR